MNTFPYPQFVDRYEAGERLSDVIKDALGSGLLTPGETVVAGVTDGGMPLAYIVAATLQLPFEPAPIEPIQAPHNADMRIGVIVDDGFVHLDRAVGARYGASGTTLDSLLDRAEERLEKRMSSIGDEPGALVDGKEVILVDDIVNTGLTTLACADWLKRSGAKAVHLAVAVGTTNGLDRIRGSVDSVLCLAEVDSDERPSLVFTNPVPPSEFEIAQLVAAVGDLRVPRP